MATRVERAGSNLAARLHKINEGVNGVRMTITRAAVLRRRKDLASLNSAVRELRHLADQLAVIARERA